MKKTLLTLLSKSFLPGFKATLNSILKNTIDFNEQIICLDMDLDDEDRAFCTNLYGNLIFETPIKENYGYTPISAVALKNSFYKLECFRIARNYDYCLMFDSDMVFIKSIKELIDIKPKHDLMLAYHPEYKEFNSGLLILNNIGLCKYQVLIDFMKSMKNAHLGDQTVITQAISKGKLRVSNLDNKWNTTKRQVKLFSHTDYVGLHFVGKKPWNGGEAGYEKIESIWHQYYEMV